MKPSGGVALIVVLAVAPLLLPVAAFSPNFSFVRQVTLRFSYDGGGVTCEERPEKLLGFSKVIRYGPVESASNEFVAQPEPDEVIATLALSARDGVHHPLIGIRATRQTRAMKVDSSDVVTVAAAINRFVQHPSNEPLILVKSQSYPAGFVLFDGIGFVLLLVVLRFWTAPLCLAAWRKLEGAPANDIAEPFIKILGRAGDLADWASKR
jgi:hypothetical protein